MADHSMYLKLINMVGGFFSIIIGKKNFMAKLFEVICLSAGAIFTLNRIEITPQKK